MVVQRKDIIRIDIADVVMTGFSDYPKHLPSWLLYDKKGDKLFQQIMELPEYYPTRCEFEILTKHQGDFARYFSAGKQHFNLIELGAGNGVKTEILICALRNFDAGFTYSPVDVSNHVLLELSTRLQSRFNDLDIKALTATYDEALNRISSRDKKVVLFLGANIGNMTVKEASAFMGRTSSRLNRKDVVVIGFDLKKEPSIIQRAYDDTQGVTRAFNLNLLERINSSLHANFRLDQFEHSPIYNPETGTAASYLISLKDQEVTIGALGKTFHFSQWETIHTEISQKYDLLMIDKMMNDAGLEIIDLFFDEQHYFCDVVATKS